MMKNRYIILFCFLATLRSYAQKDSIVNPLEEVLVIADKNLKENSIGYKKQILNDSVIVNNPESFTSLIRYNSPIFLREYGSGGTSSARFRGTSSSNTAVIWNGININSINNGQTGFNSLTVNLIDNIVVRSGGGSIKYGTGASGGTIHLNTDLKFGNFVKNQFITSIGSFGTYRNLYRLAKSTKKTAINVGVSHNISDNDYKWLGTQYKNTNGAYENLNINLNLAFKLSEFSKLSVYFTKFNGERQFSGELPNPRTAREKYQDLNHRTLSVFEYSKNEFSHILKAAYLIQEYRYFADKSYDDYDFGKSVRSIYNYDFTFKISSNSKIEAFTEYENTTGYTNEIEAKHRNEFSQSFIFAQNINSIFSYNIKVRKSFNSVYNIPLLAAFGASYRLNKNFKLRGNASKNFRAPTINDLYWPGQGNPSLKPETSKQFDIGISYKANSLEIGFDYFQIESQDNIVWTPNGNPERPGVWVPINLNETMNKGIEFVMNLEKSFNNQYFSLKTNYSFINAIDKSTNKLLIFTPKHLLNLNSSYRYKKWSAAYQFLFNGKTFTSEDNLDSHSLPGFNISNINIVYTFLKNSKKTLSTSLKINNLFNKKYIISPRRIMPNRNFNININYKF